MIKNFARFETVVAGKIAHFLFENDNSITVEILKEMAFQITAFVGQIEAQTKAQEAAKAQADAAAQAKPVEAPVEAPKE